MANQRTSSSGRAAVNRQQRRAAERASRRGSNQALSTSAALAIGLGLSASHAKAETFTVTTLADSGPQSLRAAIAAANSAAGADTITFQSGLTGTITLSSGQLQIDDTLAIQGPGASTLTVSGNNASRVFLATQDTAVEVAISGLKITGGSVTGNGAGIQSGAGHLVLEGVEISGNSAAPLTTGQGGGLWVSDAAQGVSIAHSAIEGNAARTGGGIYIGALAGPLEILSSRIAMNDAELGAGIFIDNNEKPVTIEQSTVAGNNASGPGGGIYMRHGGTDGTLTLRASTISGNTSAIGGALAIHGTDAPTAIESSTLAANQATKGGAIYCYECDGLSVRNSTIAANVSSDGAVAIEVGLVTLSHVIVADNTARNDNDLVGMFTASNSLIESTANTTVTDGGGNVLGADPQLGVLEDNGGPTLTKLPAATSPAIDAGEATLVSPPSNDQRGRTRVVNGRIDIGAVERNSGTVQCSTAAASVPESGGTVTLTVTRTGGADGDVSVRYSTANGTAVAPDDYAMVDRVLSWTNGESTAKDSQVSIADDQRADADETFTASLSNPSGIALGPITLVSVTIADDDGAPTIAAIPDQTVTAGGSTSPISFAIGDSDNSAANLLLSATSSNPLVLEDSGITLGGSAANRSVTIVARTGGGGESTVTITVSDGTNTTTRSFKVTVTPLPGSEPDLGSAPVAKPDAGTAEPRVHAGSDAGAQADAATEDAPDAASTYEPDAATEPRPAADSGYQDDFSPSTSAPPASDSSSDSACGCNIPGRGASPKPLLAGLLGLAGLSFRRRRRSATRS